MISLLRGAAGIDLPERTGTSTSATLDTTNAPDSAPRSYFINGFNDGYTAKYGLLADGYRSAARI